VLIRARNAVAARRDRKQSSAARTVHLVAYYRLANLSADPERVLL
jgi:hypothetical protein